MPVKTIAMKKLKGQKRTFYMDEHGGYRHKYVDFYPAELVEKIIEDLSNQVLDERKKWTSVFDYFKAKRKELRNARHASVCEKDKEIRKLKRALWLARASEASKEVNYWTCQDESSYAIVDFNIRHETIVSYKSPHHRPYKWILIWENVERKCRAKAEEYK